MSIRALIGQCATRRPNSQRDLQLVPSLSKDLDAGRIRGRVLMHTCIHACIHRRRTVSLQDEVTQKQREWLFMLILLCCNISTDVKLSAGSCTPVS